MRRNEKPRHESQLGQGKHDGITTYYHTIQRAATTARRDSRQGSSLRAVHPDGSTAAADPTPLYVTGELCATVWVCELLWGSHPPTNAEAN